VPFSSVAEWQAAAENVKAVCSEVGRNPDEVVYSAAQVACIGADETEFERRAAAIGREPGELRENGVAGLPHEVEARINEFREAGCERLYLQFLDVEDLDHLDLIAATVL